ncbi:MAG: hypothetical protein COA54_00375 [Thiotrichaceae bacterium]|nr:MAG: hypothetical protein COA54_00375 [Thiotrichaceae bacterium]
MNKDTCVPPSPLIAEDSGNNVGHQDTLNRIEDILQLLTELDLSEEWSAKAKTGHYWILLVLIDSIRYVSDALASEADDKLKG